MVSSSTLCRYKNSITYQASAIGYRGRASNLFAHCLILFITDEILAMNFYVGMPERFLPHDPYVYDATCKPITLMDVSISTPQQYIDHVQCANILLLNLIDDILESSENPPIIIFQSDEGSRPYNGQKSGKSLYDFADATDDYLLERTGIQNAYFFPDQNYAELYQGISPVNTFRTIFRQYFNIDTPNLEDKTYVFPNDDEMFNFIDATERINNLSTP